MSAGTPCLCSTGLVSLGRLAWAYSHDGQVPRVVRMKAAKPQRSSSESAHCHFHHILLVNARHKASPDAEAWEIDLTSSREELQSDAVIFAVCHGPHVLPQGPLEKLSRERRDRRENYQLTDTCYSSEPGSSAS